MFWIFILMVALAVVFVRVGMLTVAVSFLAGGLQLALIVIAVLAVTLIWRRLFGKKQSAISRVPTIGL